MRRLADDLELTSDVATPVWVERSPKPRNLSSLIGGGASSLIRPQKLRRDPDEDLFSCRPETYARRVFAAAELGTESQRDSRHERVRRVQLSVAGPRVILVQSN